MPVLPDKTGPVIDSRGSCVPHSLDSIALDHRSFMEAGGDLKSAKRVLFSCFSSVASSIQCTTLLTSASPSLGCSKLYNSYYRFPGLAC